ncbi:hypothetical protein [Streptomyces sp. SudanB91_2054]|uniref:hypothetical protein n=1 Tax=Streptomyces sp. SudanB91_2054 TaxID=3035278 RepID=UPI0036D869F2
MSVHLISQDIETGPTGAPTASGGTPTAEKPTPRLKGRIVHQLDKNAVMTIESTLKQRDLLGSSRLSQLLDAAVSDRDSVWHRLLDRAEPFPVSAFRDGLPEKIPPLHQSWNTQCQKLAWVDRHTEPETMTQLRRESLATARAVWHALLPAAQVAEFGPPTVEQLQARFKAAVAALAAAAPSLKGLPERLHQLEGHVAQGCTAREYEQPEAVAGTLDRYNATAAEIRMMWTSSALSHDSRAEQDGLTAAAKAVSSFRVAIDRVTSR